MDRPTSSSRRAACLDEADAGSIDTNYNARVESFSSKLVNAGTIDEQIEGTFRVSGLDVGDQVVVEIWMVFSSTMPDHVGGTIAAQLVSAQKALIPPEPITVGSKTISIGNLNKTTTLPRHVRAAAARLRSPTGIQSATVAAIPK